jgi:hypothetical protein
MRENGPIEMSKNIFHSELRQETDDAGGYAVLVIGTQEHRKRGKLLLVVQSMKNTGFEQLVWPENDAIERRFTALAEQHRGQQVLLKAHGTRERAALRVFDRGGAEITPQAQANPWDAPLPSPPPAPSPAAWGQPAPAAPAPNPFAPSPPTGHEQGLGGTPDPTVTALYQSLLQAKALVEQFQLDAGRPPTDLEQRVAVTLFIEQKRR